MTIITNNILVGNMSYPKQGIGSGFIPGGVENIGLGNPSGAVISITGSDIFWDSANSQYNMAQTAGGSNWIKLGSVS